MLTKAILTGGVLSALAGCIVYFGTEGADATIAETATEVRVDDRELAGAPDTNVDQMASAETVEIALEDDQVETVEANDPPRDASKPKVKWLDQYLKKSKTKEQPAPQVGVDVEEVGVQIEVEEADIDVQMVDQDEDVVELPMVDKPMTEQSMTEKKKARKTRRLRFKNQADLNASRGEAKGSYVVSKERPDDSIDLEGLDLDALDLEGDIDVEVLKKQLGIDGRENVEIRVIKKKRGNTSDAKPRMKKRITIDYDLVLAEARKLLVIDMRNQAVLEIVDYAVDNGDMAQAADLVEDLSTPALRDTARGRIGTGLARRGNAEAAFAVLGALEIDELSAPIRLEIITALMATQQERNFVHNQGLPQQ